jgi:membrane protease YdiL (CAAX protease family)
MQDQDQFRPPHNMVRWATVFEGSLGVLAIGLGWLLDTPPAQEVRWTLSAAGVGAAASLPALAVMLLCSRLPVRPMREMIRVVDQLLVPLFGGCRLWELALISVAAGFGEEMLFRGVTQPALAVWFGGDYGPWAALVATSILFGFLHLITPAYAILASLIGLYLGWLWMVTGNLLVPIAAHAAYDFLMLVYLVRIRPRRETSGVSHHGGTENAEKSD